MPIQTVLIFPRETFQRYFLLLRWLVVIVSSLMIVFSEKLLLDLLWAHLLVIFLILSNLFLHFLPERILTRPIVHSAVGLGDIFLITLALAISGQTASDFYLAYFLVIMITALNQDLARIILSTTLIMILYGIIMFLDDKGLANTTTLLRLPFFYIIALFYGYLVQLIRAERRQKEESLGLYRGSRSQADMQKLLKEISQDITSLDINSLLRKLTEKVREVFKVDVSDIRILEGESWRVMEISGLDPNLISSTRSGAIYGRLRWIVENRKPLMIPDSAEEETFPPGETVKTLGLRGYLGVPLLSRSGEVTGILRALTYQPRVFTQEEIDLLQQLANGAAVALENARLFEEVQKKSKELEEAFRAKSEFLNTMAHEIRTPLNVVIGHTELLEGGFYGDLNQKIKQRLETIGKNARTIVNLTDEILELARLEAKRVPLQIKEFPLKEMMDELEMSFIPLVEEKGLDLRFKLEGAIRTIKNDPSKIKEVVQNLLANAIKYTDRGEVELRVSTLPDGQSSDPKCGQISFSVRDTGIGIKGEDIPYIFEPFFMADGVDRVKYPGTGLGLSIVKRLVTLLGGEIKVESEWGKGSTFTFILPVVHRSEPHSGKDEG